MDSSSKNSHDPGWDWISENRQTIGQEILKIAESLPGKDQDTLRTVATFFKSSTPIQKAVEHPDVLTFCLSFLQAEQEDRTVKTIPPLVRQGLCQIGKTASCRGRFRELFLVPILLVFSTAVVVALISTFVISQMELIALDFEIKLPYLAEWIFKMAKLISIIAIPAMVVAFVLLFVVFLMNMKTRGIRLGGDHWLDHYFKSRRSRAAGWAWHMSLLLNAGIETDESVSIAGNRQRGWLRKTSLEWSDDPQSSFGDKYQLLDMTLAVNNPEAQIELFQETAHLYWSQSRSINNWWASWFAYLLYFLILAATFFTFFGILIVSISVLGGLGW